MTPSATFCACFSFHYHTNALLPFFHFHLFSLIANLVILRCRSFSLSNSGPGCFAMADAVKNGGLLLAPVLTLFLGIVCVHAQHILVKCSEMMRIKHNLALKPDYAETVELCFASSSNERFRSMAITMRKTCNIFICITQFGFCCVYFVFISGNLQQVLAVYGLNIEIRSLITLILLPIGLSALITNLKLLGECRKKA